MPHSLKGDKMKKLNDYEAGIIAQARAIFETRELYNADELTSVENTKFYLQTYFEGETSEKFVVVYLTAQHNVIAVVDEFRGTIDSAIVYAREIVKGALKHNAAAVIFAHNHPSGINTPSNADIEITKRLKSALALIDVRVLDHIVIGTKANSMLEKGLI